MSGDAIFIGPPLTISEWELDIALTAIEQVMHSRQQRRINDERKQSQTAYD